MPMASGVIGAPKSPWTTRAVTSQGVEGASAHAIDANVNPTKLAS